MAYLYLFIGIVLLLLGGDFVVRAAVDLALRLKVSILVIGMTVVSFATSAPELLVSLDAGMQGYTDISFGNIIGSNIANIALILGLTAVIFPLDVKVNTYKIDWWVMMVATLVLFMFLYLDNILVFWEACVLVLLLFFYNYYQITRSRRQEKKLNEQAEKAKFTKPWLTAFYLIIGIGGLKYGSDFLVEGAVELAQNWGVSQRIIGITVVSVGTSLPELAASLVAAVKSKPDLSVGNLIGSNIFNILAVLGITGMLIDLPVNSPSLLNFDFPVLFIISIILYFMMRFFGIGRINRWEAAVLFLCYVLYIIAVF